MPDSEAADVRVAASAEPSPDEARRTLALTLAVELRRSPGDVTAGHVTRTARAFEAYLRNGTVER